MRGCHQTAGMPLYPLMCTHKGWDTGQGLRLQAGLTNSNKTGSGSQNPKAQKIAVGRKNTQCLQSALPPPSPHSQAFTASLVPGRSPNLCSEESTENTRPVYWLLLASLADPPLPSSHSPPVGCSKMSAGLWGFRPKADRGVLARPGGERAVWKEEGEMQEVRSHHGHGVWW